MEEQIGVAWARDEAEAEMIQGLLESEGIPSFQQRTGLNGPMLDFAALEPGGGSRRILVNASRAEEAQALLAQVSAEAELEAEPVNAIHLADAEGRGPRNYGLVGAYARVFAVALLAFLVVFALFLILRAG